MVEVDQDAYGDYLGWKSWKTDSVEIIHGAQFAAELSRAKVPEGGTILELGFGEGEFLQWATGRGYRVIGVEVIKGLVDAYCAQGYDVHLGTLPAIVSSLGCTVDAVVAFDVFEHLDKKEIRDNLHAANLLLSSRGCIIVRVPNGASPFGRYCQYGDITHKTVLHSRSLEQLGRLENFYIDVVDNAARRPVESLAGWVKNKVRGLVERIVALLYLEGKVIPLDQNITIILRKNDD